MVDHFSTMPKALQNRKFSCGELVVKASPFAHVISMKANGRYCDWCAMPSASASLRKCSACRYEHYCNKQCQTKAWKYHKFECPLIKARLPRIPADSVRLFTKIMWNMAHGIVQAPDDPNWRVWNDLCHHSQIIKTDDYRSRQWMQVSTTLYQYVGVDNMRKVGMMEIADMLPEFGKMLFNGFTLTHMCEEVGAGVYISPSVFNHSCSPNATHVTIGTTVSIRALREIDTSKEPIMVNYTEPMQRRKKRRNELWKDYYFHCMCPKCSDFPTEALLESTICPSCKGDVVKDGESVPVCVGCQKKINDSSYVAACEKSMQEGEHLVEEGLKNKPFTMDKIQHFVKSNHLLSNRNVCLAMVKCTLYSYLQERKNDAEAYSLGEELTSSLSLYYPEVFPVHSFHQCKQARIAWHLDKYDQALNHYRKALKLSLVTHGPNHPLTLAIKSDLPECEFDKMMFQQTLK